jgi:hypothetical protein
MPDYLEKSKQKPELRFFWNEMGEVQGAPRSRNESVDAKNIMEL